MNRKPSAGVIVIGILSILVAVLSLVWDICIPSGGPLHTWVTITIWADRALAVLLLAAGFGILLLRRWGMAGALVYALAHVALAVVEFFRLLGGAREVMAQNPEIGLAAPIFLFTFLTLLRAGYPVVLLIFFSRKAVREQFVPAAQMAR